MFRLINVLSSTLIKSSLVLAALALLAGCNLPLKPLPTEEPQRPTEAGQVPFDTPEPVNTASPVQEPGAAPTAENAVPRSGGEPAPQGNPGEIPPTGGRSLLGVTVRPFSPEGGLEPMLDAGLHWTRRTLTWAPVEPQPGERNWETHASLDEEITAASEAGVEMILVLEDTPAWAIKPGFACNIVAEDRLNDLAAFAADWVARYTQPPFNVHYFELWNEPDAYNFLGCWGDPTDEYFGGRYYGQMLQIVYPRMKAAAPDAQVLIGGLLMDCTPENTPSRCNGQTGRFFEGILEQGAGNAFDGVSFHAYDYYILEPGKYGNANWNASWDTTGPTPLVKAGFLRSMLEKYNVSGKYLMNTESALLCGKEGVQDPACQTPEFEATKAAYLAQAFASAYHDGLLANIWYTATGWRSSGLLTTEGGTTPAYKSYRFLFSQLDRASIANPSSQASIRGYDFVREDGRHVWMMWSADGSPQFVSLPDLPLTVYRVTGEPLNPGGETPGVVVDWSPVYVVFE